MPILPDHLYARAAAIVREYPHASENALADEMVRRLGIRWGSARSVINLERLRAAPRHRTLAEIYAAERMP